MSLPHVAHEARRGGQGQITVPTTVRGDFDTWQ